MSTPWETYNEVNQNNTRDYSVYRCIEPASVSTGPPWFNGIGVNICPCDPNLSNHTGRGFTACPLGINQEAPTWNLPTFQLVSQIPSPNKVIGNMYGSGNQFVPPQLQPRQLIRIGTDWRSSN